jgi:hypothetical protein
VSILLASLGGLTPWFEKHPRLSCYIWHCFAIPRRLTLSSWMP